MPGISRLYTSSDTWVKHPRLRRVDVIVRGGGGLGTGYAFGAGGGGGGGGALEKRGILAADLPDEVDVIVGAGGVYLPDAADEYEFAAGGDSAFGDLLAGGGASGHAGGMGGYAPYRGGNGSDSGGESVSMVPISVIAGGGGGGQIGGSSGLDLRTTTGGVLWPGYLNSGRGGSQNSPGEWPSGGGGLASSTANQAMTSGAAGCVAVIEYHY